jgi:5-methylcytosine-specific restriction enzyme subunit McrC
MNKGKNIIQVFEHQTLKVDVDHRFTSSHFNALERYGYQTQEKYFSVGNKRIKFSNYVGVIQVKNLTIEILPKADNYVGDEFSKNKWHDALISMLHECKLIKLESISNARLKLKSASILDLYFDVFLTETERLVRQGLLKSYRNVLENLNKVKGRIDFTEHTRRNYLHKERFFVEYKIYDVNNRLNQILLKALIILSRISSNPAFNIRIKRLLLDFERVEETNILSSWFTLLNYNRNSERYKTAIDLAKLIILKYSPDLKGGNENVLAIMFDMNILYENYVYRKLKPLEYNPQIPITKVREQYRQPFWEKRGIRADIVVESESGNFVIDTKWKVLKECNPSDNDLKQAFTYNLHYKSNLCILLHPKTTFETAGKKPYKKDVFKTLSCQVAFIDLFKPDGSPDKKLGYRLYEDLLKDEIENFV